MNLNLTVNQPKINPVKGDILVFKHVFNGEKLGFSHYLIIEDRPRGIFTLLNLSSNNLMSSITGLTIDGLIRDAQRSLKALEYCDVITADEFELTRKKKEEITFASCAV